MRIFSTILATMATVLVLGTARPASAHWEYHHGYHRHHHHHHHHHHHNHHHSSYYYAPPRHYRGW